MRDGERLLPEKKLAKMFHVNHLTLRKALAALEEEGLLHKIASKGNFIGKAPQKNSKSNLIGLLIPEKDPFFFDIIIALEKHLSLFNCGLVLQVSQRIPAREAEILKYFAAGELTELSPSLTVSARTSTDNSKLQQYFLTI